VRALFCTQAEAVRLFAEVHRALGADIEAAGFTVADRHVYSRWLAERPGFEQGITLLKEWEVTGGPHDKPDLALLRRFEEQLGVDAGLFGAIVADRRLFMGRHCTYSQDYDRRFTDDQLLAILQLGLVRMEKLFDELRPDVVIGFICVTMIDYLAALFARARGIRVLNLRPTRVGDHFMANSTLNDPSPEFAQRYAALFGGESSPNLEAARAHVARVRQTDGKYEGVVSPSNKPALRLDARGRSPLSRLRGMVSNYLDYRRNGASDNHVPDPLAALAYAGMVNPLRAWRTQRALRAGYVTPAKLKGRRFAFFPLHTEPEVSLLVYGRPYVNQIEILRWLAISLPADMILVVKEHPWMVGKRTMGAYRKILNIPRVVFADPSLSARSLVQASELVAVITGSVALEAALLGKPVITFGECPFNLFPPTMLRRCDDPRTLPQIMRELIDGFRTDDRALEAYVAAVMDSSVRVNFYSVLLGKKNVHIERAAEYGEEIAKLAAYLRVQMRGAPPPAQVPGAARW
jgi:hypothetical protein